MIILKNTKTQLTRYQLKIKVFSAAKIILLYVSMNMWSEITKLIYLYSKEMFFGFTLLYKNLS